MYKFSEFKSFYSQPTVLGSKNINDLNRLLSVDMLTNKHENILAL